MAELAKPGRDPRQQFENVVFAEGIEKIGDLIPGMKLPGVVTNITAFGAFVDIGVHQDGLVHVSEMADGFVKSPADVVKVSQKVDVTVLAVDLAAESDFPVHEKAPGEKPAKTVTPAAAERNPRQGKDLKRGEVKKVKDEPKGFNNPFAEALKKR